MNKDDEKGKLSDQEAYDKAMREWQERDIPKGQRDIESEQQHPAKKPAEPASFDPASLDRLMIGFLILVVFLTIRGCQPELGAWFSQISHGLGRVGHSTSKEELAAWVKAELIHKTETDEAWTGLSIGDVALVKESPTRFTGYVEFRCGKITEKPDLSIVVDSENRIYQCEPPRGIMMQLAQVDVLLMRYPEYTRPLAHGAISLGVLQAASEVGGEAFVKFITEADVGEYVRKKHPWVSRKEGGADKN